MAVETAGRDHVRTHVVGLRYVRVWTVVASVVCAVLMFDAVIESRPAPLIGLLAGLSPLGGFLFVSAPVRSVEARRQYGTGVLSTAAFVLVLVGMRDHLSVSLGAVGLLGATSPWAVRWIAGP